MECLRRRRSRRARAAARSLLVVVMSCLAAIGAHATGVREVSVDEMLRGSQLVFEGRIIASEAIKAKSSRMIYTHLTFEVLDVIRGSYTKPTLELKFLGGAAGGKRLTVDGMYIPEVGEKGIYFVESLSGDLVHPLYGWSQGHFVIVRDAGGVERVVTEAGFPVVDVEPAAGTRSDRLSEGAAAGVTVSDPAGAGSALTVTAFKERLSAM